MSDAVVGLGPTELSPAPARSTGVAITPRNIRFMNSLPPAATWLGGDIVGTALYNALSLTFPDGERMFMDSVRFYKDRLSGQLLQDANDFIAQEAIHTREHVALNKIMDGSHYPLDKIRAHIKRDIEIVGKLGPMAMLGATISLEHFTAMLGDSLLRDPSQLDGAPEDVRRLWLWHAFEETEHKAVAFDVFEVAAKDMAAWHRYLVRVRAMAITTVQFVYNISNYTSQLLEADGMGRARAWFKTLWFMFGKPAFFRKGMKGYWSWYKPGFHPWQHDNRALLESWRAELFPAG